MELKFQVQTRIQKPVAEVFDSLVNPKKLCGYFTKTASGPLVQGGNVFWTWAGDPKGNEVLIKKIEQDKLIALEWQASRADYMTRVEIVLEPIDRKATLVKISETGWKTDQNGLESSYDNCQGWQHMTCCMKAFLEHDIDLRGGAECS